MELEDINLASPRSPRKKAGINVFGGGGGLGADGDASTSLRKYRSNVNIIRQRYHSMAISPSAKTYHSSLNSSPQKQRYFSKNQQLSLIPPTTSILRLTSQTMTKNEDSIKNDQSEENDSIADGGSDTHGNSDHGGESGKAESMVEKDNMKYKQQKIITNENDNRNKNKKQFVDGLELEHYKEKEKGKDKEKDKDTNKDQIKVRKYGIVACVCENSINVMYFDGCFNFLCVFFNCFACFFNFFFNIFF